MQRRNLRRQRMRIHEPLRLEREDREIIPRVHAQQLVGAELEDPDGGLVRQRQHHLDAFLAKDVDLPVAELALAGADGDEGLDGIVCYLGDAAVEAIVLDLVRASVLSTQYRCGPPRKPGVWAQGGDARSYSRNQAQTDQVPDPRKGRCEHPPVFPSEDGPWCVLYLMSLSRFGGCDWDALLSRRRRHGHRHPDCLG